MRTLNELKKIMEIEGLLDRYGNMFDDGESSGKTYPRNDYSGLNSLRARLRNRHWDGKSPLANDSLAACSGSADTFANGSGDAYTLSHGSAADSLAASNVRGDTIRGYSRSDYLSLIHSGNGCVGSPVCFFFELGTAELTDKSQLVNLDELARVAKKFGLSVTVVGAADAATGNAGVNKALSESRADYIAGELAERGLAVDAITRIGKGGISDYAPIEANRHTKVMLFMK